jgi:predicted TIM-barrel fold metal-dependent hydrolase
MSISRRQFTASLGILGAAPLLRAQPSGGLPPDCLHKAFSGRVDIDVHCHVFNGTDLQVEKFLVSVAAGHYNTFLRKVIQALAKPLQRAVWRWAPRAGKEREKLGRFPQKVTDEHLAEAYAEAVRETDKAYSEGFAEELETSEGQQFLDAYREYLNSLAASDAKTAEALQAVSPVTELNRLRKAEELLKQLDRERQLADYSVSSVYGFIRSFFAYRFEHVYYLLHNYGCDHGTVQMIAAALVDYDYPLGAGGNSTPSPLIDQFKVMARISEVFGGRLLTYLPFDPWRVVFEGPGLFNALSDYIAHGAAIGVKLYPPMGFAPLNNAKVSPPPRSWPAQPADFAHQLDKALAKLWEFATEFDVPVIAHAERSNAPADDRVGLGSPDNWQAVFARYPKARVCFGHFGGEELFESKDDWPKGFLNIVSKYSNAYGDISYFAEVLKRAKVQGLARRLSDFLSGTGEAPKKMLYGSDWEMLALEARSEVYFDRFAQLLSDPKLFKPEIPSRVLSANAEDFLGLHSGQKSRSRLEAFYKARGVDAVWLKEIA